MLGVGFGALGAGRWALDVGRWGFGRWAMGDGRWALGVGWILSKKRKKWKFVVPPTVGRSSRHRPGWAAGGHRRQSKIGPAAASDRSDGPDASDTIWMWTVFPPSTLEPKKGVAAGHSNSGTPVRVAQSGMTRSRRKTGDERRKNSPSSARPKTGDETRKKAFFRRWAPGFSGIEHRTSRVASAIS